jgi:hypothetical protein
MKGFALVAQITFQPSRTYPQYDLAALVSIPDIDETMTFALASVDKSMYPSVTLREPATITSDYLSENIFYTDGSMIDNVTGFAVHNRNHLVSFRLESLQFRMALEHIQILSDRLSSFMAVRSKKITCKTYPWVYESKQIYWDLKQPNYNVKLM